MGNFRIISVQEKWVGVQVHESALATISLAVSRESHKVVLGVWVHGDHLCWILSLVVEWSIRELKVHEFSALAAISFAVPWESDEILLGVWIHSDQFSRIFGLVVEWSISELKALEVQDFQVHQLRDFLEIHQEVGSTSFLKMDVV